MEKPLDTKTLTSEVGKRVIDKPELPPEGMATDREVYTEVVEGSMLKRGRVRHFEVFSDEGTHLGGTDKFPNALGYLSMAVGF